MKRAISIIIGIIAIVAISHAFSGSSSEEEQDDVALTSERNDGQRSTSSNNLTKGNAVASEDEETMLEKPSELSDRPEVMLYKRYYTVSYNTTTFCPNYVAWHLTRDRIDGNVARTNNFHPDESLSEELQVVTSDYSRSGFDRGHMCPAGDNKSSQEAMSESFCMTNMCPQVKSLNCGPWNALEEMCREWVRQYDDLYIVCGPIFDSPKPETIGKPGRMKISVPDRFFKVVLRMGNKPQAIGFIYENSENGKSMRSACMSVDNVEEITNIDFFPALPDNIENSIEAEKSPNAWGLRKKTIMMNNHPKTDSSKISKGLIVGINF